MNAAATAQCVEQTVKHNAYKSSLSFKDVDQSYWYVDDTTHNWYAVRSTPIPLPKRLWKLDELIDRECKNGSYEVLLNTIKVGGNKGFSNHMIFAGGAGTEQIVSKIKSHVSLLRLARFQKTIHLQRTILNNIVSHEY